MTACKTYSIRRKLFFRISAVILGAFFLFVGILFLEFQFGADEAQEQSIIGIATKLQHHPERFSFSGLSPGEAKGERLPIDGISIGSVDGRVVALPTRWRPDVLMTPPLEHDDRMAILTREQGTGVQLFTFVFLMDGEDLGLPDPEYVVHISRPLSNFDPIVRSFLYLNIEELWWMFALLIVVAVYITKRTIDGAMQSVSGAAEVADSIDIDRLDVRLPTDDLPVEVLPLATKTNDALDRLEEIIRAERSFTSSAAHELRTPLAVLRSKLEQLPDGEVRTDTLRRIDGLSRIVGQLLQLARVDAWQPDPANEGDADAVAREIVSEFSPRAVHAGGDVSFRAETHTPWRVDRVLLEILLVNLLENALKHGASPAAIDVAVAADGLTVDDNGPGIPPEDRADAVKPFWRADRARKDGVGIGLALAARIAEQLGGALEIDESPGGGCRVRLVRAAA